MRKSLIAFLSILMVLAVACSTYGPQPSPPEPSKPAQTQTAPAPQPAPVVQQPAQTSQPVAPSQPSQSAPVQPASTAKTVSVAIKSFKFTPADITVNVGDTIVWTNEDSVPHTVESPDGTLRSNELSKGDTYKHTFAKAGEYNYICGIHHSMHGSVTVQ